MRIDERGTIKLPIEVMNQFGFQPGEILLVKKHEGQLTLSKPQDRIDKIYIEPTNSCNLGCRTCMRNVWDEPIGWMSPETFSMILRSIQSMQLKPLVFFGGFGEPLAHSKIHDMVTAVRQAGAEVELITNGILLDENMSNWMIEIGVKRIWVSIDGATPQSYLDVRLGDSLPKVIANLKGFKKLRLRNGFSNPRLGIAFVAMKRNIDDLPEVIRLGKRLGADLFSVSHVLAHTKELAGEVLYQKMLYITENPRSPQQPMIQLPRMEINPTTQGSLLKLLSDRNNISIARQEIAQGSNSCPFIESHSVSIRWDGAVSPCLPLLHTHESYLDDVKRKSYAFSVGNINGRRLFEIWNDPIYVQFRERLKNFDFSPCTVCNSCDMSESNLEDCFGNISPTCGGCLWAQGFIQCP